MTVSVQKALSLLVVLLIGFILRKKFGDPVSRAGIRTLILTIALPSTIFVSILGIKTGFDFVSPPLFAVTINLFFLGAIILLVRWWLTEGELSRDRALILIFPSLAPGLTVFPFVEDFMGSQGLAWVALADVGNKIFVLFVLYALAIYWGQRSYQGIAQDHSLTLNKRIRSLAMTLLSEPINIAILLGFALVGLGITEKDLPFFVVDSLHKISAITTPLILLFVGMSFRFNLQEIRDILAIILVRSSLGFLLSSVCLAFFSGAQEQSLLFVVMPQAACSLWPLLHTIKVNDQVKVNLSKATKSQPSDEFLVFNTDHGISLLTLSFPFSIGIMLFVFADPVPFQSAENLLLVSFLFLALHIIFKKSMVRPIRQGKRGLKKSVVTDSSMLKDISVATQSRIRMIQQSRS